MTKKGLKIAVFCLVAVFLLLGAVLFRQLNGSWQTAEATITFDEYDFGTAERIKLQSMHTGEILWIQEPETVEEITEFLKTVKGINPESAKGFYEGTYTAAFYEPEAEEPVFEIGFGDSPAFYYGENADDPEYPNRYVLDGMTIETVTEFFGQYLSLDE